MSKLYEIDEEISLTIDTTNMQDGEKIEVKIVLVGKNKKELDIKPDTTEVQNNKASYKFTIQDIANDLNIDIKTVYSAKLWMDNDGDGIVDYNEEIKIDIIHKRDGILKMGLFFDGTGNDDTDEEKFSNIKKLFLVYPNNFDPKKDDKSSVITDKKNFPNLQSAYIRGVGSSNKDGGDNSTLGGALALGATQRLEGMLYYIEQMIDIYEDKNGYLPLDIEFDIFGFSRGAAAARHFVNVLKQDNGSFYKIKHEYKSSNLIINTLNLFDTVGSLGLAGKDYDPGFTYHIKESYIKVAITHFVANDEYRYNFDGQVILSNDLNYPKDIISAKTHEYVLLGAHSDIGGGYKVIEHQLTNNDLPKVYLNKMYERCVDVGVPFLAKPKISSWEVPKELRDYLDYFEKKYNQYPNLKLAHKKLREWQALIDDKFIIGLKETNKQRQKIIDKNKAMYYAVSNKEIYSKFELDIVDIFNNHWTLYNEFLEKSNNFHDEYIHISHTSSIFDSIKDYVSFGAEEVGNTLHRTYFEPKYEDMRALTNKTKKMLDVSNYNLGVVSATLNTNFETLKSKEFKDI